MEPATPAPTQSVYHSAASSPARSASALSFYTPAPTQVDNDATPRPTLNNHLITKHRLASGSFSTTSAIPLLQRYISNTSYTTRDASTTSITPSINMDDMPIVARLRKRVRGSRSPSKEPAATTIRASPRIITIRTRTPAYTASPAPTQLHTPARAISPLVETNLLQDLSPHSETYATTLEHAVDQGVASLMQRGRTREGHGMRELYHQSFKDPGTAELLDALLRQRASERQQWDFDRFVEDVNKLGEKVPVVVIQTPMKSETMATPQPSTVKRIECETHVAEGHASLNEEALAANLADTVAHAQLEAEELSERLPNDYTPMSAQLTSDVSAIPSSPAPYAQQPLVVHDIQTPNVTQNTPQAEEPTGAVMPPAPSSPHLSKDTQEPQAAHTASSQHKIRKRGSRGKRKHLVELKEAAAHQPRRVQEVLDAYKDVQLGKQARRKKKKKQRMFFGHNGPVYFKGLLGGV